MIYQLLSVFMVFMVSLPIMIICQPPPDEMGGGEETTTDTDTTTADLCDADGKNSTYTEYISDDGEYRVITASGCANHDTVCVGKDECPDTTEARFQDKNITIPAIPCFNNYSDNTYDGYPVYCLLDNLGIALNGVSLFGPSGNAQCADAVDSEKDTFDTCGGHAEPGGTYHYHSAPACLLDQLNDADTVNPDGHSPQAGWSYDGFPVYGPHGLDGSYILPCDQDGANASDCTDNCGGHGQHTIDGFKYHYHIAGPVGDLVSSPVYPYPENSSYPYIFGCFKGIPTDWSLIGVDVSNVGCAESGVTDDYNPTAIAGVTELYVLASDTDTDTATPSPTDMLPPPDDIDDGEDTTTSGDLCDAYGATSTYYESIDYDSGLRHIEASGCPNHDSVCVGKDECPDDETEAIIQNKNFSIPATPCFNNYSDDTYDGYPVYCLLNNLGIAFNGVSLFSPSGNEQCDDAVESEKDTFDTCGGHAEPSDGIYHYHSAPACLLDQLEDADTPNPEGHSPQAGWAYDGFPVYGPHGLDGEYILPCTLDGANSSDCLDNCGGHRQHTIDGFKYHYHIAGPIGDLVTSPVDPTPEESMYPYIFGCFKGIPSDWSLTSVTEEPSLSCSESGVTDDYVVYERDGITEVYVLGEEDTDTNAEAKAPMNNLWIASIFGIIIIAFNF